MEKVSIRSGGITLQAFLKWCGAFAQGGEAKIAIQAGEVRVNGETERRRGRHLQAGDQVGTAGKTYLVTEDDS